MGLAQMLLATSRTSHAQQKQPLVNVETDWVCPLGETHCAPVNLDVTNTFFFPCTPDPKNTHSFHFFLRASVALGNRLLLLRRSQDRRVGDTCKVVVTAHFFHFFRNFLSFGDSVLLTCRSQDRCVRGRERVISNHVGRPRGMRMSFLGEQEFRMILNFAAPATAALHDNFCATRNTCRQHFR